MPQLDVAGDRHDVDLAVRCIGKESATAAPETIVRQHHAVPGDFIGDARDLRSGRLQDGGVADVLQNHVGAGFDTDRSGILNCTAPLARDG